MLKEDWLKTVAVILFIVAAIVLILLFLKSDITGRVISIEKNEFMPNESIQGNLNLIIKEGELIPSSTRVIITLDGESKEMSLKEFIESSNLVLEEQQGNFFVEGKELEGQGFGYGFSGHYLVYPDVSFQLKISSQEPIINENETVPLTTLGENGTNATNETNETLDITQGNIVEGNIIAENLTEVGGNETVGTGGNETGGGEGNATEVSPETPPEQPPETPETPIETPAETPSETPAENTPETLTEPQSEGSEIPNPLSGFVVFLFRTFGIWNGFSVLAENANSKIIEATCSSNNSFTYELAADENALLVPGSVKSGETNLKDNDINLDVKDNVATVSTDYFESFEGFGKAYLGGEHELNFDLKALNISSGEPGIHDLTIKFLYQGQEIISESEKVQIISGPVTIKVVDKDGKVEDEIVANDTKVKVKIGKIIEKGKEKNELEVEYEENAQGITGGAIIEQQPLPESEINFISMPNNTIIQIDKSSEYQTEVFAVEPSEDIEIESATITLEKTTTQEITQILYCDDWNLEEFDCQGEWKDSGLEFLDNGTHVSFITDHFTAYIGAGNMTCPYYMNESVYLVDSVQCNGTAFIVNTSNIFLDCQGNSINYSVTTSGYGVNNSGGFDNVTIRNCVINQIDATQSGAYAIYFNNAENSTIKNNLINVAADVLGVITFWSNSHNNNITNNSIEVTAGGSLLSICGSGSTCANNRIAENNFTGGSWTYLCCNSNVIENNNFYNITEIEIDGDNNLFANNYVEDSIRGWADGTIYCNAQVDINNTFFNNTISTYGDDENSGIWVESCNQTNISSNNITTNCLGCKGILFEYPHTMYIDYNNITTYGDVTTDATPEYSYGIYIRYIYDEFKYIRNNIITTSGIGATGVSLYNTETYTTESRNIFRDNVITTAKGYGFDIYSDCANPGGGGAEPSDIDTSNLVEGKPVYYYCNVSDTVVEDLDAGQIIVGYSYDVDPANLTLRNVSSEDGILLAEGINGVLIEDSIIDTDNQEGIAGVYMKDSTSNVSGSELTGNYYGVYDADGGNYIYGNNISGNVYGVVERLASSSQIYSNVMDSNTIHILLNSTPVGGGGGSLHNVSFNNISGGDYGIYLENEDSNTIEENNISNVNYAIYVNGTRAELAGSNAFNNNTINSSGVYDFYTMMLNSRDIGNDTVTNLTADNVSFGLTAENVSVKRYISPGPMPPPTPGWQDLGKHLAITNNTENSWMLLNISYLDSELGTINESTLRIWKHNGSWYEVDSNVDDVSNIVYMNNPEPPSSIYTIMGQGGADSETPTYDNDSDDSGGSVEEGTIVNVYTYWHDNIALDIGNGTVLRNGVMWPGELFTCTMSGADDWCNSSIDTTGTAGDEICWYERANDTSNNLNNSMSNHCFNVTAVNCNCTTCAECETKLSNPSCSEVNLTADIPIQVGTCIDVPFSNKVFNLNEHLIMGDPGGIDYGILAAGSGNTIKNGRIDMFHCAVCLDTSASNNIITNIRTMGNSQGIYLIGSNDNNSITNCTANSNFDYGIYIEASSNNNVTNCTAIGNGWDYYSTNNAENNTVKNLTIATNLKISFLSEDVSVKPDTDPGSKPTNWRDISKFVNVTNNSVTDSFVVLNVSYNESALGSVRESSLRIWSYDNGSWDQRIGGVDTVNNIVYMTCGNAIIDSGEVCDWRVIPNGCPVPTPECSKTCDYCYELIPGPGGGGSLSIFAPLGQVAGGGGGGGGAKCGDGTCENDENCYNCPQDCGECCGNSICESEYDENYTNCPDDCCAVEGETISPPKGEYCCEGLTPLSIMIVPSCAAPITPRICTYCGNHICGLGENYCNCPQDCLGNVTNCSQLPKLDAQISWNDNSQSVMLSWASANPIIKTKILAADKVQGQGNLSNFSAIEGSFSGNSWVKVISERLKFLQIIAKVKIGNQQGECKPECYTQGLNGGRPGWYDPCTETFLKEDSCVAREPKCCFNDTRSEGWYNISCDLVGGERKELIRYGECEEGEYALACNQSSDIFAKFTQPLTYNEPGRGTANTSINWIVFVPISGWTRNDTQELLTNGLPVDYIAYWDASRQEQHGSARGDPSHQGSFGEFMQHMSDLLGGQYLPGISAYAILWPTDMPPHYNEPEPSQPIEEPIVSTPNENVTTGRFNLTRGYPYFVGANYPFDRWTWVGEVPEHVIYELKHGEMSSYNYIVLPLDTTIKKASDLCRAIPMGDYDYVFYWDTAAQDYLPANARQCKFMKQGIGDFNLNAGQVYRITIEQNRSWTQI